MCRYNVSIGRDRYTIKVSPKQIEKTTIGITFIFHCQVIDIGSFFLCILISKWIHMRGKFLEKKKVK